jgi:hypothetical protein
MFEDQESLSQPTNSINTNKEETMKEFPLLKKNNLIVTERLGKQKPETIPGKFGK